ncbi:uncharacterized protein [Mytilus edulis]|uniref:uncharacterized protein n=1 Tax=Mytilus edulis TaxID=6550 RepID=UPI0039F038A9
MSYLSNRKQKVVISGQSSDTFGVNAGVPQGSILGPLLFLVYINDIVNDIDCNIKLYADDTSLFIVVEDEYAAASKLNSDIETINNWSVQWLVNFNAKKTEAMTVSKKSVKPHHPPLYMNDDMISEVESHKHLGLIFHEDGSWHSHVNKIIEKITPRLNLFRALKFKLKRKYLQTIYLSFIRPLFEYTDIIWDNIPDYLSDKLENMQLEAARIVTGGTKLSSINKLYDETGWELLSERRKKHKIIKFHEMFHNKTPDYLSDIIPQQLFNIHNYDTRRTNDTQHIKCRTAFYQKSFLPSVIRSWNAIPDDIRLSPSKFTLKSYLNQNVRKMPNYYFYGDRKGQILHARLRMDCSNLNEHLFKRNLVESKNCTCGRIESSKHFLLECYNYSLVRKRTIKKIPFPYNIETLLFGCNNLNQEENVLVFKQVQQFLVDSKRFG